MFFFCFLLLEAPHGGDLLTYFVRKSKANEPYKLLKLEVYK